jgi:ferredoxin
MGDLRIEVDADRCVGHGNCYTFFPELFADDPDGRAVVLPRVHQATGDGLTADPLTDAELTDARNAVSTCPERAIAIVSAAAAPGDAGSGGTARRARRPG